MKSKPKLNEFLITKEGAAQSQLEMAIWLWVTNDDPISIHTLAAASNDILHALGAKIGHSSLHSKWLKAQPQRLQQWVRDAQIFFKHAFSDVRAKKLRYFPIQAEILMFDSVLCWATLFKEQPIPPMLQVFGACFVINNADLGGKEAWPFLFESLDVDKLRRLDRLEFFKEGSAVFGECWQI